MKTFIHELGVIDKTGVSHPVRFKQGLNVVTGKSSTGKSALIEIFDYCFGSGEYTIPKGVITDSAALYYVYMNVNGQDVVLGRFPSAGSKAFFRREDAYSPEKINKDYFVESHLRPLGDYKKHVRDLFLDINDVDESLAARENRRNNAKAPTPSIRSFVSFMLQHQNLVANKHALFYRFDEKEKRDQAIDHTKIFLGLVDQKFFHLSQKRELLAAALKRMQREQEANKKLNEKQKLKVEPVLLQLYAGMGFDEHPVSLQELLRHPVDSKEKLDKIICPENVKPLSDAITQLYLKLQQELSVKTSQLRKLQRQGGAIKRHIDEEEKFVASGLKFQSSESVSVAKSVCPFCDTELEGLQESAEHLRQAILKVSNNLMQAKPMRARFESSLVDIQRQAEVLSKEVSGISKQIDEIKKSNEVLNKKKSLYESILVSKAILDMLLDSLSFADDKEFEEKLEKAKNDLKDVECQLKRYDYREGLSKANIAVNRIMKQIGKNFEFEDSYKPINLHFSFETFDLYHLTPKNERIFLRSMGSGANWLYSHVALFLALHKYFASLGERCAVPSILFLDQPTQVYFPSFRFDKSEKFDKESLQMLEQRDEGDRQVDDDMKAVENLFSQLSIYCTETEEEYGFTPQIIVTDHADDLKLSDGTDFEKLVNQNRWRNRGLINPVPILSY